MEVLKTPIKSASDKKDYRLIRLENGLKVLLISKTDEKSLSAAALTVFVGSYDNPPAIPGLAHFFEHMIFLDQHNYDENFKDYIESHSGYCNAMTGNDFTSYEFKINDDKFPEAIVRFAHIFTSPTLSKSLMKSERINVDSEFRLRKADPVSRRAHLHRLYLNQHHHASIFPTGNLQTLKENIDDDQLHAALLAFLDNYVANKMALCVQSNRPLDVMQQIVVDNFSAIKKNVSIKFKYEDPVDFDALTRPEFYSKILYIKDPNENNMALTWLVPSVMWHYKSKPIDILGRIFENNEEGGLVPYLKDRNLITSLNLHHQSWLSSTQFTCLRLDVELTDEGYEKVEDVLSAIYSYLLMIKETPRDEYRRLYKDVQEQLNRIFEFISEESASSNVEVARRMNIYADEDIVRVNSLLEYDEDILMDYISRMNDGKFNITFITKNHENFSKHEDMYEIEYDELDVPESFKTLWNERKAVDEFILEQPNPYKAENFEIFTDHEEMDHPEKIFKNEIIEIWHLLDRKFKQPIVKIHLRLLLKDYSRDCEMYVYMRLLQKIAAEVIDKKFAKSQRMGFSSNMQADVDHINITFDGYNDKMLIIVEETFKELKNLIENVDENLFKKKCEAYRKSLIEISQSPNSVASGMFTKILSNKSYEHSEIINALDTIKFESFSTSIKEAFQQIKAVTLVQGNMLKEDAMKIPQLFQSNFQCQQLDEEYRVYSRGYQIPKGSHTIRLKSLHPTDDLSLIMNYYQIGPYSIHIQNLASMISMYLDPKAFDFLRTKHQLSYNVTFQLSNVDKIIGFSLKVTSNENSNDYIKVYKKIEEFVNVLCHKFMDEMTDDEFTKLKAGRISTLSEPHLTLGAEFSTNFREIREEAYNFNRTSEAIEDAKKITKQELQKFFLDVFDQQNMRKLMIQVIGNNKSEAINNENQFNNQFLGEKTEIDENIITDIEDFKKSLMLYPVNYY